MLGSTNETNTKSRGTPDIEVWPLNVGWQDYYANGNPKSSNGSFELGQPYYTGAVEALNNESGKFVWFKNCKHDKVQHSTRRSGNSDYYRLYFSDKSYRTYTCTKAQLGEFYSRTHFPEYACQDLETDFDSVSLSLSDTEIEELLGLALVDMVPRIDDISGEFSLVNFLYEFKDMKQMTTLWSRQSSFIKNFSGGVLNYELGWKPFLNDCEKIMNMILTFKDTIDRWNRDAHKGVIYSRHANLASHLERLHGIAPSSETSEPVVNRVATGSYWSPSRDVFGDVWYWDDLTTKTENTMIAHMYFRPIPIKNRHIEDFISQWFDLLGGGDGMSIVWNAIPFSFVADWFWSVGDFIRQFDLNAIDVGYEIVDFGYSIKRDHVATIAPHIGIGGMHQDLLSNGGMYSYKNKSYIRRRCHAPLWRLDDIEWSYLWDFKIPTWKQGWIGLNLVLANS
jgi:hypothetical protein